MLNVTEHKIKRFLLPLQSWRKQGGLEEVKGWVAAHHGQITAPGAPVSEPIPYNSSTACATGSNYTGS